MWIYTGEQNPFEGFLLFKTKQFAKHIEMTFSLKNCHTRIFACGRRTIRSSKLSSRRGHWDCQLVSTIPQFFQSLYAREIRPPTQYHKLGVIYIIGLIFYAT